MGLSSKGAYLLRYSDNKKTSCLGLLFWLGQFISYTMEPSISRPQHPAIADGVYPLTLRTEGRIYDSYKERFASWAPFKGVPWVLQPGEKEYNEALAAYSQKETAYKAALSAYNTALSQLKDGEAAPARPVFTETSPVYNGRADILIHCYNHPNESEGCIAPGDMIKTNTIWDGEIQYSQEATCRFYMAAVNDIATGTENAVLTIETI
jgi:hypothetical protein